MKKIRFLIPLLVMLVACNLGEGATPTPTVDVMPILGTITGKLSYPSEGIPPLRVVAFSLTDSHAYFIDTGMNQQEYSIDVPPGMYYVVAYPYDGTPGMTGQADYDTLTGGPFAGGYTQMVPCGLAVGCEDHTLLSVTVPSGQFATADPGDWYAPEGTFPPMPNP